MSGKHKEIVPIDGTKATAPSLNGAPLEERRFPFSVAGRSRPAVHSR
jgi:hypothetical protein